ncbi:hypothetical protein CPB84DRAFT_1786049 [Gymnopilus junonius]|uniref:Uncharacterized protein n=1 Tax=Gymnopilus junonius TaxID=109634 RepID=A0A9P5NHL3_GYMJU|nr:hypothetical protein CPB84DRAFT_1786049 [Gymnopilus junonius]
MSYTFNYPSSLLEYLGPMNPFLYRATSGPYFFDHQALPINLTYTFCDFSPQPLNLQVLNLAFPVPAGFIPSPYHFWLLATGSDISEQCWASCHSLTFNTNSPSRVNCRIGNYNCLFLDTSSSQHLPKDGVACCFYGSYHGWALCRPDDRDRLVRPIKCFEVLHEEKQRGEKDA